MKLISLQDVTQSDLPFVCAPFYAWCIVDDAHSGFVRIKGYDELFENCKRQACQLAGEPSHWNDVMLGREQMDNHVKRGSLALVMESGDFPLHPMHRVFVEKNGQPQVRENSLDPSIRQRLQYHVDRLHHERLERERYAANHSLTGEPEYLPVAGPGHRPMTLGPHEGNSGQKKTEVSKKSQASYTGKLRGKEVLLQGVETRQIQYTKRDRTEYAQLRSQFDAKSRPDFMKQMANDPEAVKQLKQAGIPEGQLLKMQQGGVPKGWQVHHKIPLDDGGTNDVSNLVLIKNDPAHMVITNAQNSLTRNITVGETKTISFPVPGSNIYPLA